jgi:hypothetical protein
MSRDEQSSQWLAVQALACEPCWSDATQRRMHPLCQASPALASLISTSASWSIWVQFTALKRRCRSCYSPSSLMELGPISAKWNGYASRTSQTESVSVVPTDQLLNYITMFFLDNSAALLIHSSSLVGHLAQSNPNSAIGQSGAGQSDQAGPLGYT